MVKVERVLLVTPLWGILSSPLEGSVLALAQALGEKGVEATLAGPEVGREQELQAQGLRIMPCPVPRRPSSFSAALARRLLPRLTAAAARCQADLVHYLAPRLAALGIPPERPATGWLQDTIAAQTPLLPFGLMGEGQGWFGRWRQGRRARALQVSALARLAGLAVPSEEVGRLAARVQRRGMPLTHQLPRPEEDPAAHANGLVRLWRELPW